RLSLCLMLLQACGRQQVYNITDYGAKGDSVFMNTTAIQKAIDAAASAGGGQVFIPEGIFLTGALHLKSNVELHVTENAVLKGSYKREDYQSANPMALITARDQQNISITGKGVIDGQGRDFIKEVFRQLKAGTIQDSEWQ